MKGLAIEIARFAGKKKPPLAKAAEAMSKRSMHDEPDGDEIDLGEPDGDEIEIESDYSGSLSAIAGDLISAVKAGDVEGVAEALKAAHYACDAEMNKEEPEEPEDAEESDSYG